MLRNIDSIKSEMLAIDECRCRLSFELLGLRFLEFDKRLLAQVQGVIGLHTSDTSGNRRSVTVIETLGRVVYTRIVRCGDHRKFVTVVTVIIGEPMHAGFG